MMKIAGIQMSCVENKETNLAKAIKLIKLAAEEDSRMVCLPELFNTHWFPREKQDKNFKLAEKISPEFGEEGAVVPTPILRLARAAVEPSKSSKALGEVVPIPK